MYFANLVVALALVVAADEPAPPKTYDERLAVMVKESRDAWSGFLAKKLTEKSTETEVHKLMQGRYRDYYRNVWTDDFFMVVYLVDEFHQIAFSFDKFDGKIKLELPPLVEPKRLWLRNPEGRVAFVRTPEEYAAKLKAADAGLKYLADIKKWAKPPRRVRIERSNDGRWDIGVVSDTDITCPPTLFMIVDDNGKVEERQFGESVPSEKVIRQDHGERHE